MNPTGFLGETRPHGSGQDSDWTRASAVLVSYGTEGKRKISEQVR